MICVKWLVCVCSSPFLPLLPLHFGIAFLHGVENVCFGTLEGEEMGGNLEQEK